MAMKAVHPVRLNTSSAKANPAGPASFREKQTNRKEKDMGDPSTHVIFYSAYWHLAFIENGFWISSRGFGPVCKVGEEEAQAKLNDLHA